MKHLIPMDDYGVFVGKDGRVWASSLYVAQTFGKSHDKVLRDIRLLDCSEQFRLANFGESSYTNAQNKKQPMFNLSRDGLSFLIMGYRGAKASAFKEAYIERFNQMERTLFSLNKAKADFPRLTESVRLAHEHPKPYHFSNECDLINRVVLGMSAKQFKAAHNLPNDIPSIRPYLSPQQIDALSALEAVDVGLVLSVPDFTQRKRILEWYMLKSMLAALPTEPINTSHR